MPIIPLKIKELAVRLRLDRLVRIRTGSKVSAHGVSGDVQQTQAGRDVVQTQIVYNGLTRDEVRAEIQAALQAANQTSALPMHVEPARLPEPDAVEVAVDGFGIVRAFDLEGSRVHLDFYVANDSDHAIAVTSVALTVNDCRLRMKQFFTNNGELRTPDPDAELGSVAAGSFGRLSIEFENTGAAIVYSRGIRGELKVDLEGGLTTTGSFGTGPLDLKVVFDEMDEWVKQHQSAMAFDVPIEHHRR